ncbi:hypothetical protein KVV02_005596 [Mortierella alpina]|uniref:Uncharacterized protein n=1 Tax=Mortierella alpina TaxID=64518 RepID=A0A9P8CUY5_MORAP|nr:hypothetical protein KVV02_005596 [Mortierella alpina]
MLRRDHNAFLNTPCLSSSTYTAPILPPPRQHDNAPKQLLVIPINHSTPTYSNNAFAMSLFKRSNKTKTTSAASSVASVASTPTQTPRPSMQEQRFPLATQMNRDQALEMIMKKTYGGALTGPFIQ